MTLRIGFLCIEDPDDPCVLSGMPHAMKRALEECGADVIPIFPRSASSTLLAVKSWARKLIPSAWRMRVRRSRPGRRSPVEGQTVLDRAEALSAELTVQISQHSLDAVFGCCVSVPLFRLETDLPVVYYSDTTARLINDTYAEFASRSKDYKKACDTLERVAIAKAQTAVFATELARQSAIEDYGADPGAVHVVPLGVNAVSMESPSLPLPTPPTRDKLRLVMTAADPIRKRTDFAVEVTEILRERGWNATLDLIGRTTPRARASPAVRCAGWIDPSSGDGPDRICQLMGNSHLMILPSAAEAFGIAPGEAAHAGRPSIVSAAGGLPEAVVDGESGIVMPLSAAPGDYAAAIEELVTDPARYVEMCRLARERARRVLTWERWGRELRELVIDAIRGAM